MGMHVCGSGSCQLSDGKAPDPSNFKIIKDICQQIGRFTIVVIHYPGCTNYDGYKIIVFENINLEQLFKMKNIDPHFEKGVDIIARFQPSDYGLLCAKRFCSAMNTLGEI